MKNKFNRRDFLKLAGALPLGLAAPRFMRQSPAAKNVVIVVFDALSAYNVSLYGYPRETMPNLSRLAERAIVYHRHYAGGNYTTTGTATLLTGSNPWTHRAFNLGDEVEPSVARQNIFKAFQGYHRMTYTHNVFADMLFERFQEDIEDWTPRNELLLGSYGKFIPELFANDEDLSSVSWVRTMRKEETGYAYSLFASRFYGPLQAMNYRSARAQFPRGVPSANNDDGYLLSEAVDWTARRLAAVSQPFFGYFHFLPPHAPYRTSLEFFNRFEKDGYRAPDKPFSIFQQGQDKQDMIRRRTEYDEFILYADQEFGRLYAQLEDAGILENTILVFTSDHGELLERGVTGHSTPMMHEPLIRVPLLIFDPGRKSRVDVNIPTMATDLLPTLTQLAGLPVPAWHEGSILPPFNSAPDLERSIYVLRALKTAQDKPIADDFSIALVKGRYKLHYYAGYPEMQKAGIAEIVELYDVESDPEELNDLSNVQADVAGAMLKELKTKLTEVNERYL